MQQLPAESQECPEIPEEMAEEEPIITAEITSEEIPAFEEESVPETEPAAEEESVPETEPAAEEESVPEQCCLRGIDHFRRTHSCRRARS